MIERHKIFPRMSGNKDNDAEREGALLREDSDVITEVTMESTPTLSAVLLQKNTNMASMDESIKQLHAANAYGEIQRRPNLPTTENPK